MKDAYLAKGFGRRPLYPIGSSFTGDGIMSDLGLSGAFLNTAGYSRQNSLVNLKFHPVPQWAAVEVLARVVRTNSRGNRG